MESHEQKSRAVKVDSEESWNFFITQATNESCPVVAHFSAEWCIPSVAMNPLFEELASIYPDILFLFVDVDEVMEVAKKMEVKAMPTFVFMRDGKQVDKVVGANAEELRKRVDEFAQYVRSYQLE